MRPSSASSAGLLLLALLPGLLSADPVPPVPRVERGNLSTEGIPDIPPALADRIFQYQNARSAVLQGWAADPSQGLYIVTRFGETGQVHQVLMPGGARRQLTFAAEPVSGAAVRPAGQPPGFVYAKDLGGNEFTQLYWFDQKSGLSTLLTDGKSQYGTPLWSHKGDQFAAYCAPKGAADWSVVLGAPEHPQSLRELVHNTGAWAPVDWSADDRRLLVRHDISATESQYFISDVSSRRLAPIHPTPGPIAYGAARWSADGKGIYLASDEGDEFQRLRYYDLAKGTFKALTPDLPWDIEEIEASRDGKYVAFTANEGGIRKLYLLDPGSQTYEPVPDLPVGQISGLLFSPDSSKLGLVLDSPQSPADVYALSLADHSLQRWTFSEVGGLDTGAFVVPTLAAYPTFDAGPDGQPRQIPAFYYRPRAAAPGSPAPVLVLIHGGPEAQFSPGFSAMVQYFTNELGIAVVAPNVRGSSGYGKSWITLDDAGKREDSVKDIGALLDWIAKQPELDAKRVAVYGGSYGGYMALASLVHYSDRLRCGIDVCGISNFVTFLQNTEDYRRDLRRVEYGDERDPKMRDLLTDISPLTHADKITKPLFVVQGKNDPRVPVSEAEQIVAAVRKNNGTAWYLLASDEGHGFVKKPNRDYQYDAIALFLQQYLLAK